LHDLLPEHGASTFAAASSTRKDARATCGRSFAPRWRCS